MAKKISFGINLAKLDGVALTKTKGGKPVMCINLEECYGFSQDKSGNWWFNFNAVESKGKFGESHFVCPNLTKEEKATLPKGVREPIIGNGREYAPKPDIDDEDLPF